jgi:hypothetical protein
MQALGPKGSSGDMLGDAMASSISNFLQEPLPSPWKSSGLMNIKRQATKKKSRPKKSARFNTNELMVNARMEEARQKALVRRWSSANNLIFSEGANPPTRQEMSEFGEPRPIAMAHYDSGALQYLIPIGFSLVVIGGFAISMAIEWAEQKDDFIQKEGGALTWQSCITGVMAFVALVLLDSASAFLVSLPFLLRR